MPKDVKGVMREYKQGELHSGSSHGPVVKDHAQAVAIALSEQHQMTEHASGHPSHGSHGGY